MSRAEENKAIVRRLLKAVEEGDMDALDAQLAPDFVDHSVLPDQDPGREGYIRIFAADRAARSNVHTTIEFQATDGDEMVITRYTQRGIHHRGQLMGVAPTGQEREGTAIIHRIAGSKIAEE